MISKNVLPYLSALLLLGAFGASFGFDGLYDSAFGPTVLLALAAALCAALPACFKGLALPRAASGFLIGALWGYLSLSLLWTTVPFVSFVTWLVVSTLPLLFFAFLAPENRKDYLYPAFMAVIIGITAAALLTLYQSLAENTVRPAGPLVNPNNMASLINMALLPVLALAMDTPASRLRRLGLLTLSALLFAALIVTESRGGFVCFLIGASVLLLILSPSWKTMGRQALLTFALLAAVFAGFSLGTHNNLDQRLVTMTSPSTDAATLSRTAVWSSALDMLKDNPLTGTGLGTFYLYYPAHRIKADTHSTGQWAHNDPLQLGVEAGMAATILFYAVMLAFLLRTLAALKYMPPDHPRRVMTGGLCAALLTLGLQAHMEFPFYIVTILMTAGVWLALLYDMTAQALPQRPAYVSLLLPRAQKIIVGLSLMIVAGLIAYGTTSAALGLHYFDKARAAINANKGQEFMTMIGKAQEIAPYSFADPKVQMAAFYIDFLENGAALFTPEEQKSLFITALDLLDQAEALNPAWADINHRRARLYQVTSPAMTEIITKNWDIALSKNPMHERARIAYVRFLVSLGRVDEAYTLLEKAFDYPRTPENDRVFGEMEKTLRPLATIKRAQDIQQNFQNRPE